MIPIASWKDARCPNCGADFVIDQINEQINGDTRRDVTFDCGAEGKIITYRDGDVRLEGGCQIAAED